MSSGCEEGMAEQLELRERREPYDAGRYEPWTEVHDTLRHESQWIPADSLTELLEQVFRARATAAEASCKRLRRSLASDMESSFEQRCVDGHVVFGPHRRFPENPLIRCDGGFWKAHFQQVFKCLRCCGISDVDREFFLEQKLAAMKSEALKATLTRDAFETANRLAWRQPIEASSSEASSQFEKAQKILKLQKALLDLRVFRQDFNELVAKVEARVRNALVAVESDNI